MMSSPLPLPPSPLHGEGETQEIIRLLKWTLWNTQQGANNDALRKRDPAYVARLKNEAWMLEQVIKSIEEDREPTTEAGRIWKTWWLSWAVMFQRHYNRHDMDYFQDMCARLRAERDASLRACGWLVA